MAIAVDRLGIANWQRSKDGTKASRRPKPISPLAQEGNGESFGDTSELTNDETLAILHGLRTGAFDRGG